MDEVRGYSGRVAEHEPTPLGVDLAIGSLALVGATSIAAALFPPTDVTGRVAVIALAVGGCAAAAADTRASVIFGGVGYLMFDGFLVNRQGELTWDGMTSMWYLMVLSVALGLGLGLRWVRTARADRERAARKPITLIEQTKPTEEEAGGA